MQPHSMRWTRAAESPDLRALKPLYCNALWALFFVLFCSISESPMKRSRSNPSRKQAIHSEASTTEGLHSSGRVRVKSASDAPSAPAAAPNECRNALLVAGTYHSVMAGLIFKRDKFFMKFSIKHHVGSVNAVAVSEKYIASCGVDERVFLFTNKAEQSLTPTLRRRMQEAGESIAVRLADLGSITPPTEITCLAFTTNSQFLLCGCADGQLLVYRTRDWALSTHLPVHERGIGGIAVHPTSAGSLVISIGADRSVAVLDLAKGRLLTKWKYTSHIEKDIAEDSMTDARSANGEEGESRTKRTRLATFARMQRLEEPIAIRFSPSGAFFIVMGRYSFVVYSSITMQAVNAMQLNQPQPDEELHACIFLEDCLLVVGNEAGQLLRCTLPAGVADAPLRHAPLSLEVVQPTYPEAVASESAKLLAQPVQPEVETRTKHPLRHVSRVKALYKERDMLFSADSNGIVVAWRLTDQTACMQYVTSANCQGRVTCLDVMPL